MFRRGCTEQDDLETLIRYLEMLYSGFRSSMLRSSSYSGNVWFGYDFIVQINIPLDGVVQLYDEIYIRIENSMHIHRCYSTFLRQNSNPFKSSTASDRVISWSEPQATRSRKMWIIWQRERGGQKKNSKYNSGKTAIMGPGGETSGANDNLS